MINADPVLKTVFGGKSSVSMLSVTITGARPSGGDPFAIQQHVFGDLLRRSVTGEVKRGCRAGTMKRAIRLRRCSIDRCS